MRMNLSAFGVGVPSVLPPLDEEPPPPSRGYVAIADILGSRGVRVRRSLPEEFVRRIQMVRFVRGLPGNISVQAVGPNGLAPAPPNRVDIRCFTFSDTYIITAVPALPDPVSLAYVGVTLHALFRVAVQNHQLLRGAVSFGEFGLKEEGPILLGPAVDEAAEWADLGDWAGIIATPSADREIRRCRVVGGADFDSRFDPYPIPLRSRAGGPTTFESGLALAWPNAYSESDREHLDALFVESPVDLGVAMKRENTLRFYDRVARATDPRTGQRTY